MRHYIHIMVYYNPWIERFTKRDYIVYNMCYRKLVASLVSIYHGPEAQ